MNTRPLDMKQLFTSILIICFFTFNISAQKSHPFDFNRLSSFEKSKYIKAYNAQKRTLNIQQVLDSNFTVSVETPVTYTQKGNYYYDLFGRDTLDIYYVKQQQQLLWYKSGKHNNTFNTKDQLTKQLFSTFNSTKGIWQLMYKSDYTYNSVGSLTNTQGSIWDTISNVWIVTQSSLYTYNGNGKVTEIRDSAWITTLNSFSLYRTEVYSYNLNGNIISITTSEFDNSTANFRLQIKDEYQYDTQNREVKFSSYRWSINTSTWKKHSKIEHTYYANSKHKQLTNFIGLNNNWDTTFYINYNYNIDGEIAIRKVTQVYGYTVPLLIKTHLAYDSNHNLISETQMNFNYNTQQYDSAFVTNYTIDNYNNTTEMMLYEYISNNNTWVDARHYSFTFNTNYLNNDAIYPYGFDINLENKYIPLSELRTFYDTTLSNWHIIDSVNYYFSTKYIDFIPMKSNNRISIYPNPAKDIVYFQLPTDIDNAQIKVYDITGKLILNQPLNNDKSLSVESFARGIYIIYISNKKMKYHTKIVLH